MSDNHRAYDRLIAKKCLTSVARTNGTVTGDTVDKYQTRASDSIVNQFQTVLFVILTATLTDGVHTITVQDSDDNSTWGDAAAGDQTTSVVTASTNDDTQFELGYHGAKRYCRLKCVTTGTTTGGILGAVAVLSQPRKYPVR